MLNSIHIEHSTKMNSQGRAKEMHYKTRELITAKIDPSMCVYDMDPVSCFK